MFTYHNHYTSQLKYRNLIAVPRSRISIARLHDKDLRELANADYEAYKAQVQ